MPLIVFPLPFGGLRHFMLALSSVYRLHCLPSVGHLLWQKFGAGGWLFNGAAAS